MSLARSFARPALALATASALALSVATTVPASGQGAAKPQTRPTLSPVVSLDSPRGVDALGDGLTLVTQGDGTFSLVIERPRRRAVALPLGELPGGLAPAVALGRGFTVWLLTGAAGPPEDAMMRRLQGKRAAAVPPAGNTLYRWRPGLEEPVAVADIGAYQASDPDPYDLEDYPEDSNAFGLAALGDGSVLVADAAGNDLLRVTPDGSISTVLRVKPRTVTMPDGYPDIPPEEGGPLPPAGTPMPAEAVTTSVAVGRDGYWYVGELRGFPGTPETSQIWRVRPGTTNATCDPEAPRSGPCKRYADGLTSIMDLATGKLRVRRNKRKPVVYAVELSTQGWLAMEFGLPGAEKGALKRVRLMRGGPRIDEMFPGEFTMPAGVDATKDSIYLTAPMFGPGNLLRIR